MKGKGETISSNQTNHNGDFNVLLNIQFLLKKKSEEVSGWQKSKQWLNLGILISFSSQWATNI